MGTSSEHDERVETDGSGEVEAHGDEASDEGEVEAKRAEEAPRAANRGAKEGGAKRASQGRGGPRPRAGQPQGGSLGKSMILFVVIVGGLAGLFAYFGREPEGGGGGPKWKPGEQHEVEITLVATDIKDLACWSADEVSGRHCAFESPTKGWSKGDADEKKLLRPYTTTDRIQFLAAGVWSEPALTAQLPGARFAIKCNYTVEGKMKRPGIRWTSEGPWLDRTEDWYSGVVSGCKLLNP